VLAYTMLALVPALVFFFAAERQIIAGIAPAPAPRDNADAVDPRRAGPDRGLGRLSRQRGEEKPPVRACTCECWSPT
jgi:hypothetical protein